MKKLIKAQFGVGGADDFETVLMAFVAPFPSLSSLPGVAAELVEFLFTGEFSPKIQEAIDEDSCNGEWPGKVYLMGHNVGGEWKIKEMMIVPYTGDRYLIVRDFRKAPVWPTIFCEANYESRPSRSAARDIIELSESGKIYNWNDPEWLEVEDEIGL